MRIGDGVLLGSSCISHGHCTFGESLSSLLQVHTPPPLSLLPALSRLSCLCRLCVLRARVLAWEKRDQVSVGLKMDRRQCRPLAPSPDAHALWRDQPILSAQRHCTGRSLRRSRLPLHLPLRVCPFLFYCNDNIAFFRVSSTSSSRKTALTPCDTDPATWTAYPLNDHLELPPNLPQSARTTPLLPLRF